MDGGPKMQSQARVQHQTILKNKHAPYVCQDAVTYALSFFPELKTVPIQFQYKPSVLPHKTRPSLKSAFKSANKNRVYKVTLSAKTVPELTPLIFDNLTFNEQVGMIAHELAHITQFQQSSTLNLLTIGLSYLSDAARTRFEQEADKIVVQRGLGWELYAFSNARERVAVDNNPVVDYLSKFYLSPEEIMQYMRNLRRSSKVDFLIDLTNCLN